MCKVTSKNKNNLFSVKKKKSEAEFLKLNFIQLSLQWRQSVTWIIMKNTM